MTKRAMCAFARNHRREQIFASVVDSDRVAVKSRGKVAYLTAAACADRTTIGPYMAGH
jgi:hypothetical protein